MLNKITSDEIVQLMDCFEVAISKLDGEANLMFLQYGVRDKKILKVVNDRKASLEATKLKFTKLYEEQFEHKTSNSS